jgi:hypothetical protein
VQHSAWQSGRAEAMSENKKYDFLIRLSFCGDRMKPIEVRIQATQEEVDKLTFILNMTTWAPSLSLNIHTLV